jgi:hypothetical protein
MKNAREMAESAQRQQQVSLKGAAPRRAAQKRPEANTPETTQAHAKKWIE